ncbi:hypothetical protein Fmac_010289 [Flemingia macrophylla]|uniref:Uncharacterized protein n=1 Tax=Flemingia macrophylla TaxID=520843 RepID=A0ABD1MJ73_9FABA
MVNLKNSFCVICQCTSHLFCTCPVAVSIWEQWRQRSGGLSVMLQQLLQRLTSFSGLIVAWRSQEVWLVI